MTSGGDNTGPKALRAEADAQAAADQRRQQITIQQEQIAEQQGQIGCQQLRIEELQQTVEGLVEQEKAEAEQAAAVAGHTAIDAQNNRPSGPLRLCAMARKRPATKHAVEQAKKAKVKPR